jgi:hypothetical protein
MTMNSKTLWAMGLVALLVGGCGDDEPAGSAGGATDSASGTSDTDSAGDASMTGTTRGDASGSATSGSSDDDDSTTASASNDDTASASASASETDDSGTDDSTGQGSADSADSQGETHDELCEAPGFVIPCDADSNDPFHAMGLNCPGSPDETIPISNQFFNSPDPQAYRIARQLGSYIDPNTNEPLWGPTEGEKFLFISTGHLAAPDVNGVITMASGIHNGGVANGNPSNQQLPAPMSPSMGSNNGQGGTAFVNCDLINDCSDSLSAQWNAGGNSANDLLWFQFDVQVPGGTHGFEFDFAYFSAEFPEWVNTTFNDIFVVWSNSETYTGNLCFVNDQPCTVTALWPGIQYPDYSAELAGTGFEPDGGTGWFTAKASAAPGETLQLTWAVFDMGDSSWDTAVMLDNFQWDCEGCTPSEVNPCGIRPIPM